MVRFNHTQRGWFVCLSTLTLECIYSFNVVFVTTFHMLIHWLLLLLIHLLNTYFWRPSVHHALLQALGTQQQTTPKNPVHRGAHILAHSTHGDWDKRPRKVTREQVTSWRLQGALR